MGVILTFFLAAAVAFAAWSGRVPQLTRAALDAASSAAGYALTLVGVFTLWLGLMRVAEEAGLVRMFARVARPLLRRLFPSVPPDHPAMGAIVMNVSANVLGLGNAATPFGIKAMEELERLNPHPGTATDAQALFCAINTGSIQLIPATVIAMRVATRSTAPAEIIVPTILAGLCSVTVAVVAAKLLAPLFPPPTPRTPPAPGEP
jgi:spore maturation protein A